MLPNTMQSTDSDATHTHTHTHTHHTQTICTCDDDANTAPIVRGGWIDLDPDTLRADYSKRIHISRLHLEVDSGKSIHDMHESKSLIDLNRCGTALMEIVSEADMSSSIEAAAYVKKLQILLQHIGTCDANMEEVGIADAALVIQPTESVLY
jgi:Asp-tRNA(Asn)/Glu-tRNA(Gln) amidotransferase B subunit